MLARIALALLATSVVAPLAAQPKPGDYVITGDRCSSGCSPQPYLASVDPTTGRLTTIVDWTGSGIGRAYDVTTDVDDESLVTINEVSGTTVPPYVPAGLLRTTPAGVTVTISTVGYMPRTVDLDQDGYLVGLGYNSRYSSLVHVTAAGAKLLTMSTAGLQYAYVDPDTGDYFVNWGNRINAHDRQTLHQTDWFPTGGHASDFSARTGLFAVAAGYEYWLVDRARNRIDRRQITNAGESLGKVAVDRLTGNLLFERVNPSGGFVDLLEYAPGMTAIRTTRVNDGIYGLDYYGNRGVTGTGSARAGTSYTLQISLPAAGAGRAYVAALSLGGHRPGIPLADGRTIDLVADALFFLTATRGDIPGMTAGLRGVLGPRGRAQATLLIPAALPPIRVWATAVALDPAAPSGLVTTSTWGVTIGTRP